jgi:succinate-semialdehyde dehydrogenase / glutarate-semialdehyde dehydrogenase
MGRIVTPPHAAFRRVESRTIRGESRAHAGCGAPFGGGHGMPAVDQEAFGPVAAVVRAKDERDAVRLANDSVFGFGASVWTPGRRSSPAARDPDRGGLRVRQRYREMDPRLPSGGIKRSGYGQKLSEYGIREFVNLKSVWIA